MELTINSRKLNREIIFSRPGNSYIFVNLNGEPGTLGNQLCKNGSTIGPTITYYGNNKEQFDKICRRWWKNWLMFENDYGYYNV